MIALGDDADNVGVVGRTGYAIVGHGTGGLAIIDPQSRAKRADIHLPGHPESFQLSPDGGRAFVSISDARQIAVVVLAAERPVASWSEADLQSNFPIAIDAAGKTLAIMFRNPARLALIDAATGAVLAVRTTCGDADDVFFDERRQRIYISCGAGAVDVFEGPAGNVHSLARSDTSSGGRGPRCLSLSSSASMAPRVPVRSAATPSFLCFGRCREGASQIVGCSMKRNLMAVAA